MLYFDHASTSFPKPQKVLEYMQTYLTKFGVSPGRGNYFLAQKAEEWIEQTRKKLAALLRIKNVNHIAFTMNATYGLNVVIKGFLKPNDHVLICCYSHNAALRPLERMKYERGIEYDIVPIDEEGKVDLEIMRQKLRLNTSLLIATGASNVIGVKANWKEAFSICRSTKIKILLDVTQSLGYEEINEQYNFVDFLIGTGHKTLLGPSGIGFLYVKNSTDLTSYVEGGSHGNHSAALEHPEKMPYKFEAGTINSIGIIGLLGSLTYIEEKTFSSISKKALKLMETVWKELSYLDKVILYGTNQMACKVPIISFNIKGMLPSQIAYELDKEYKICVRPGLHCAPLMHQFLGTLPTGTIRISIGHQNTEEEILMLINSIKEITRK